MILYANGDSFTEGVGLPDHDLFQDKYPGDLNSLDFNVISKWAGVRLRLTRELGYTGSIVQENNKRAWPAHLGKRIGASVINAGVGGSSMFSIMSRTIHDIDNLLAKDIVPDIVMIGLTSEERIPIPNDGDSAATDISRDWIHNAHPSHLDHLSPRYQRFAKEYWGSFSDEQLLIFFMYQCLQIKYFVNAKLEKNPIFVNTSNVFFKNKEIVENSKNPLTKELWAELNFDSVFEQKSLSKMHLKDEKFAACGHFKEAAHIRYAEYIHNNLLLGLIDKSQN